MSGEAVPRNAKRAVVLLDLVCQAGSADECLTLAEMYDRGDAPGGASKAAVYYDKACKLGEARACAHLGRRGRQP
jgi:TPR repeat protein